MDSDKKLSISGIATRLGISPGALLELASLADYSEDDALILFEALLNRMSAVIGDDQANLSHWLMTANEYFGCRPFDRLRTMEGFREVILYLQFFAGGQAPTVLA